MSHDETYEGSYQSTHEYLIQFNENALELVVVHEGWKLNERYSWISYV